MHFILTKRIVSGLRTTSLACLLIFSNQVYSNSNCSYLENKNIKGHVIKVMDGDSARIKLQGGKNVDVRFLGVDTPESEWRGRWKAQPFSKKAAGFTRSLINGKSVSVSFNGQGTYDRCVGEVFVNNTSVSYALINNGLGWWYERYAPNRDDFEHAQASARSDRVGIWSHPSPTAPWQYRKSHSR